MKVLGATSTTDDVLSGVDLHGKWILVTGVSAGIGVETARALAARRARRRSGEGSGESRSRDCTGAKGCSGE
jgi:NAD(P)-dependent dehydrogenase (short-subunit alcohol dehydrogenase family)